MLKKLQITGVFSLFVILLLCSCIDLEPKTSASPIKTNHTITAFVDSGMGPIDGALVTFEVISGPNMGKVSIPDSGECSPIDCISGPNGEVKWTYTSVFVGNDLIVGSFLDLDGLPVESEPVEQLWISQIPTLSEWGFVALALVLGLVGILAVRRRKVAV